MAQLLQFVVSGLAVGAVYAIVALGFVLVYKSTDVFNFAHQSFMMVGAYLAITAIATAGLPFGVSVLAVIAVAALMGVVVQIVLIRPLIGQTLLIPVMVTIALSLVIDSIAAMVYGPEPRVFPSVLGDHVFDVAGVRVSSVDLTVIGVTVLIMAGFALFFRRSSLGLYMRATAESAEAALLSGIPVNRVFTVAFGLATALAAVGGILLAHLQLVSPAFVSIGLIALPAAVIGGLMSIPGAVVGGFLVGVLQQISAGYAGSGVQDVVVYIVLLIVIMVRPYGLLGQPEVRRV